MAAGRSTLADVLGVTTAGAIPVGVNFVPRKRSALVITDTDDRLIANAAIIGDNNHPVNGYNTPAASGTPSAL